MSNFDKAIESIESTNVDKVYEKVNFIGKSVHIRKTCLQSMQPENDIQGSLRIRDQHFTFLPDDDDELIIDINVRNIVSHEIDRKNSLLYLLTKNCKHRSLFCFEIKEILKTDPYFNLYFLMLS